MTESSTSSPVGMPEIFSCLKSGSQSIVEKQLAFYHLHAEIVWVTVDTTHGIHSISDFKGPVTDSDNRRSPFNFEVSGQTDRQTDN